MSVSPDELLLDDPFRYAPANSSATLLPTPSDIHANRVVYFIYLLVFWLHAQCHLPFRACNAVLICFGLVLRASGVVIDPPMAVTLPTVMTALNADPVFPICPVCPSCQKVYPPSTPTTSSCCTQPLFNTVPTSAEQRHGRTERQKPKPRLQFPYKSLEEQLATMLANPGVEEEIECSIDKVAASVEGVYTNIFDGKICKELPCKDGSKFFSPSAEVRASGELRIGVSLGVDWYSILPYTLRTSDKSNIPGFHIYAVRLHHPIPHVPCPTV